MKIPDFVNAYLDEPQELVQTSTHIFGIEKNLEEYKKSENRNNKKAIIISGLSGAGKSTIMDKIIESNEKLKQVRTCTTRKIREEELNIEDPYIRITTDQLHEMLLDGTALECTEYAGNYYCTSRFEVEKITNEGMIPVLRVDPPGAMFFLESRKNGHRFLKDFDFIYLFVVPTSFEDLRERLIKRGSSPKLIEERMEQSRKDITFINSTHYIVVNEFGELDMVLDEVKAVLSKI